MKPTHGTKRDAGRAKNDGYAHGMAPDKVIIPRDTHGQQTSGVDRKLGKNIAITERSRHTVHEWGGTQRSHMYTTNTARYARRSVGSTMHTCGTPSGEISRERQRRLRCRVAESWVAQLSRCRSAESGTASQLSERYADAFWREVQEMTRYAEKPNVRNEHSEVHTSLCKQRRAYIPYAVGQDSEREVEMESG